MHQTIEQIMTNGDMVAVRLIARVRIRVHSWVSNLLVNRSRMACL
jgi:hypothetical protein